MPRTFSLFRLMLGITALCLFRGLAVNYPMSAKSVATSLIQLSPTILAWVMIMRRSEQRIALGCVFFLIAISGLTIVSAMLDKLIPPFAHISMHLLAFATSGMAPALFAFLICAYLIRFQQGREHQAPQ
jgi:hypothetical protein